MIDHKMLRDSRDGRIIKIVAGTCFLLLAISAIVAWDTPAKGYEPSIYNSTPPIFWVTLFLSIACGVAIIVGQIYKNRHIYNDFWLTGFLLLLLSFTSCLSLYIIRGYYIWDLNGDVGTHLGFVNQILSTGYAPNGLFGSDLIYPITHFYAAEAALMLNQSAVTLFKLIPLYLSLLFIGFMYVFARAFLGNKGQAILVTMAGCLAPTDYYVEFFKGFMPYLLANLFFPLIIFTVFKYFWTKKPGWGILSILTLFASVPFHPVLVIALVATLAGIWAFERALAGMDRHRVISIANIETLNKNHVHFAIVIGLIVCFFLWIRNFSALQGTINGLVKLMELGGPTYAMDLSRSASTATGYGYNIVEYVIRTELSILVVMAITAAGFPLIVRQALKSREIDYKLLFYAPLALIAIIVVLLYFLNLSFEPTRLLFYIFTISILIVGFVLNHVLGLIGSTKRRYVPIVCLGLVTALIIAVFVNGVMTVYPSPYVLKPNDQTTLEQIRGVGWALNEGVADPRIASIKIAPFRFGDALLSPKDNAAKMLPRVYPSEYAQNQIPLVIPYHFGYDNNTSLASVFDSNTYMILTSEDKSIYTDVIPNMAPYRFTDADYDQLDTDIFLYRLYSNGDLTTWFINDPYH